MNGIIQNKFLQVQNSKVVRIVLHLMFWLTVAFFYFILFSWNSEYSEVSIIFSSGLLPVAMVTTYFFNYVLIPNFLWKKKYGRFFLFCVYTLLVATWLSFLIVSFALIYIINHQSSIDPATLHPEQQVITLFFVVFLAIAVKQIKRAFWVQQEKNELENLKITTELKLKDAELKLLKAQIHPHFLFNTLNNLYGLTLEKSDKAPELVLQFSEILDYILYRCNEKRVLLSEELNNLKNYIEIEKIRYSEKLKIEQNFTGNTDNLKIAPLILLPFVENAFKHGVSKFPGVAFIKIHCTVVQKNLIFRIENIKNPLMTTENKNSTGIGLQNVKKRLDLMYPEKFILGINDQADTFSVNLTLELEE